MTSNASSPIRTRFAPSPTGFLHLGGARTALFSWAFARHHKGTFVLRIEDTDVERSTPEAVQAILDSMDWLGMQPDEGPFYQMQRMDRYREVVAQMLAAGTAYHCYSSPEEVEAMREAARARGDKPRYDGTWRPEPGKTLPPVPEGRKPVVRFKNPQDGATAWNDMVKGPISFDNTELDDLIIARPDGTPTYNFCVVVDDWDMGITHVLRGDDHVNNTPRQINILRALGATLPEYGHVPMILGPDGEKLSKRHGAVNVMEYDNEGYLPEAMINYLARLGWSHGDDELFSRDQLVEWFDTRHLSKSASQWDPKKLNWVNAHYIKQMDNAELAERVAPRVAHRGGHPEKIDLPGVMGLLKDRAETLEQLADGAMLFCGAFKPAAPELVEQHLTAAAREALADFARRAQGTDWTREAISALIKAVLADRGLKMPQLAIPLRVAVTGQTQTPAVDAVLALLGKDVVLQRLAAI
ncbi:glutamate--tRNA ligase [Achromobacter xylosoxidans]|jgi:glutamyl-tRNA synthetase|uniref:Glutamate--tRNA ligase n=1 Tax=Alcaligenes xylosoxydans xylosoxydans TaxID=85698 RepID=A0A0D6FUC8_ALCXX|nr:MULTISPECIES: glutamate--tRNA ligase [Achromobacter]AHC45133.1 Glutamyl-tRNA synthetase [Achromobacter xylosoxidans NBRC 15126 = ATCC 27061]AUZ19436.1 glutamate--tRNA ligase [Achromobacter xylosoxidans]AXA75614.1 glutamate--tRNA ligase [Achromobacter xylosoxidans]EFV83136.1 glutamyl-tRNA synthetase [Achromobacter xylosoxidans C54]KOQ22582.1 glutamyl-tRNA synthetase [Achromobacter xylosoxidans]